MPNDILTEFLKAWKAAGSLAALLALAAAAAFVVERALRRRLGRARPWAHAVLLVGALAGGLWLGWQERFLCDDAFISFRYARNFAEGHGLVWNKGEWVEGYTNFLWTALLGALGKLGADIPLAALFGCLASFVGALLASAATVRRCAPKPPLVPFAAIALAGSLAFHTFATSGLETMPAAALVITALYASTLRSGALWAGLLLTAAALTRPDHVLFVGCFGLSLVLEDLIHNRGGLRRRLDLRRYLVFMAPFVLVYVPYYLARWHVYGDFYPNTYYTKSGGESYFRQGFLYGFYYLGSSGAWVWLPAVALCLLGKARTRSETRARLFAATSAVIFSTYIMKVGGDFMEFRFFVPLMPIAAAAAEIGLRWRLSEARAPWSSGFGVALAAAGIGAACAPIRILGNREIRWGISREPTFYAVKQLRPLVIDCNWQGLGQTLKRELYDRGLEPPIAAGAIGLVGYYSRLPLIDSLGLTNRFIAHKILPRRGRPGHEKVGSIPELVAQGAVFDVGHPGDATFRDLEQMHLGSLHLSFLRFDPVWAAVIQKVTGARMPDPERDAEAFLAAAPRERALAALSFYKVWLAGHPSQEPVLARVRERLAAIADFEGELPEGAKLSGPRLKIGTGELPIGASGKGWLGAADVKGQGRLEIPIESIDGDELRFALGGPVCDKCGIDLVVDGKSVRHAAPSGGRGLIPVSWPVGELFGKRATLVIEDTGKGRGLMVDAVHWAPAPGDIRERIAAQGALFGGEIGDLLNEAQAVLPPGDPDRVWIESHVAWRWSLDTLPEGSEISGKAFGKGPTAARAVDGQEAVVGIEGQAYLNSAHGNDPAKGKITLPEISLPAEPIWVLVAGGRACHKLYVGLEVRGRIVQRVCGRNDQRLRREALTTGSYAGRRGRVVIVDDADGGWGHIVVDDILVLKQP